MDVRVPIRQEWLVLNTSVNHEVCAIFLALPQRKQKCLYYEDQLIDGVYGNNMLILSHTQPIITPRGQNS